MPLTMVKIGEAARIREIAGKDEVRKHLEDLGFLAGETVTVVSELAGNMILQIRESRIALDKSMASRIMV